MWLEFVVLFLNITYRIINHEEIRLFLARKLKALLLQKSTDSVWCPSVMGRFSLAWIVL